LTCRLADGRTLDSKHVVQVVKAFIDNLNMWHRSYPRGGCDGWSEEWFGNIIHTLDSLEPGHHLGGDGILDLLEYCTENE
jgi:hypothetical protein